MFIFREAYYLEHKEPTLGSIEHAEWQQKMDEISRLADIMIGKQRHGPTGNVKVEFRGNVHQIQKSRKQVVLNISMFNKIYKNLIIEKPRFTLSILIIALLLSFGYFSKELSTRRIIGHFTY